MLEARLTASLAQAQMAEVVAVSYYQILGAYYSNCPRVAESGSNMGQYSEKFNTLELDNPIDGRNGFWKI